ncbi:uncharacterized protein LOC127880715 [Dreissena polymorpha]|uniref:Uncharacterized protein n=1 Tax=Dreissena polymorpha TaxID=45954 RepID=A0A9D4GJR5_DREPO|nr:uncharacterized protein LOC127880715 [Dreissena polymorpha]KAH3816703.1 hypothetical protein DPMN_118224 [Dreissena polymorpha]
MRFEQNLGGFREQLDESPQPLTREGSASVYIDMSDESSSVEETNGFDDTHSLGDTPEGRLSRSLQSWMIDHEWHSVKPLEKPPKEPVFSGRLGKDRYTNNRSRVQHNNNGYSQRTDGRERGQNRDGQNTQLTRIPSDESIYTCISLLTCSFVENESVETEAQVLCDKRHRKKRLASSHGSSTTVESSGFHSKWVEFANRRRGAMNQLMRAQNARANDYGIAYAVGNDDNESEAFRNLDKEDQSALFSAGMTKGLRFIDKIEMKKSESHNDLVDAIENSEKDRRVPKRTYSANAKRGWGKSFDIGELKRERMNKLLALEQERLQKEKEKKRKGRRPQRKSGLQLLDQVHSQSPSASIKGSFTSEKSKSHHSSRQYTESERESQAGGDVEEKVETIWKGDREILEIDLKRELTHRVKEKIASTRTALKRVTGVGETNERKEIIGRLDDFPYHTEDDFSHIPRIVQKMRISPHLSGVIHNDIQVRMGRPRYHEVREQDLEQWNKGQFLNRAHTNLKVFNWLHSLRNVDFTGFRAPEIVEISDELVEEPEHIEAADDPDVKPMFQQYSVRIL